MVHIHLRLKVYFLSFVGAFVASSLTASSLQTYTGFVTWAHEVEVSWHPQGHRTEPDTSAWSVFN